MDPGTGWLIASKAESAGLETYDTAYLDLLILRIVAFGPVHGYAIAQRFEHRGLLGADRKETKTGREAKFYKLTRKGRSHLESDSALAAVDCGGAFDSGLVGRGR